VVNTDRIEEFDPRSLGLLGPNQEFVVCIPKGDDWGDQITSVQANMALVTKGVLEFWNVVDGVWNPAITFAPGWWSSYRVALKESVEKAEVVSPDEPPQDLDDLASETEKSFNEIRQEVLTGLVRGEYPQVGGVPTPKKLKDVWEGRGDPDDGGPESDLGSWPADSSPEEINAWVAEQARKDQEIAAQLRKEADAERDDTLTLPEHLRDDDRSDAPDYTAYSLPRTEFYGSDGTSVIRR